MELRDGFIVGVFNYCDRWCERCAFTSHCRLFADRAEIEASLDPYLKAITEAPPLPEDVPPPPPEWLQELIEGANEASREPIPREELQRMRPRVRPEHEAINARATSYASRTYQWLTATAPGQTATQADGNAREVISWFHFFIAAKVHRTLTEWPDEDPEDHTQPNDTDGSAKVALLGIDRSHAAWLDLVERGLVSQREADAFIADLVWLGEALERVRPHARGFIRPGFDEPDAAARLLATGGAW
jgi:hypothetical protein